MRTHIQNPPRLGVPRWGREEPEPQDELEELFPARASLREAEDFLDWLEAHGRRSCHLSYAGGEGFRVWE
jgi:hypothetical protein